MPQPDEKLVHGTTHLSGGVLTLRLTSPFPRQPQEAPPERAEGSGLEVPDPRTLHRKVQEGTIVACESKKGRSVRQLQTHLAYLQRQQGLPTGLTGGWNQSAEEKLHSWLLTDVKGMKDSKKQDSKKQLALQDKPHGEPGDESQGEPQDESPGESQESEAGGQDDDEEEAPQEKAQRLTPPASTSSSSSSSSSSTSADAHVQKRRRVRHAQLATSGIRSLLIVQADDPDHHIPSCEDCRDILSDVLTHIEALKQ